MVIRYGMKGNILGKIVQIDYMLVCKNGVTGKHDPPFKFIHTKSNTAKKFLLDLKQKAPFIIKSIQVNGGSEFMKEFEEACCDLGILPYVLPSKRPQYNGGVE